MRIKLLVHSHDTALPEHDQVHFHTPDHPGGLMVLRLPKGSPLPPVGREYTADFVNQEEALQQDEHLQKQLDAAYEQRKQCMRDAAQLNADHPPLAGAAADRSADTLGKLEDQPTGDGPGDPPPPDNAHLAEGAERFDDEHGPAGSDQGGA